MRSKNNELNVAFCGKLEATNKCEKYKTCLGFRICTGISSKIFMLVDFVSDGKEKNRK